MADEDTPLTPKQPSAASNPAAIENLADSDDAAVLEARAKLLEAQAELTKANTPLFDKIVIRGVIPIALAIVGPWAAMTYSDSQVEQRKQGETISELQDLLTEAREEAAARQERSAAWQVRMKKIEEEKAVELAAMSAMVGRLDDMLKTALIQMAVSRLIGPAPRDPGGAAPPLPERAEVLREAAEQIQLPGLDVREVERIAGQQYDRMIEQRRK